jgi:hypothetical protein
MCFSDEPFNIKNEIKTSHRHIAQNSFVMRLDEGIVYTTITTSFIPNTVLEQVNRELVSPDLNLNSDGVNFKTEDDRDRTVT